MGWEALRNGPLYLRIVQQQRLSVAPKRRAVGRDKFGDCTLGPSQMIKVVGDFDLALAYCLLQYKHHDLKPTGYALVNIWFTLPHIVERLQTDLLCFGRTLRLAAPPSPMAVHV